MRWIPNDHTHGFVWMEGREMFERGEGLLTRKDLRASATRNAASMVSNCSGRCD